MEAQFVVIAYIISNIAALLMLFLAWKFPKTARLMYMALFGWASWANTTTALENPGLYLDYANYTFIGFYKDIILGVFSENIILIVISIAFCQALIAISMIGRGWLFKTGTIGAIIFLLSIAPFGVGSGFPCTIFMAIGLWMLIKKEPGFYIWETNKADNLHKVQSSF